MDCCGDNNQANVVQYRLIVRQVKTLQITRLYTCLDAIQHVEVTASVHATVIMYVLYSYL